MIVFWIRFEIGFPKIYVIILLAVGCALMTLAPTLSPPFIGL